MWSVVAFDATGQVVAATAPAGDHPLVTGVRGAGSTSTLRT